MPTATEQFFTAEEVALKLRRNVQTVRRYALRGLLEGTKVNGYQYMFTQAQIDAFLAKGGNSATAGRPARNPRYAK